MKIKTLGRVKIGEEIEFVSSSKPPLLVNDEVALYVHGGEVYGVAKVTKVPYPNDYYAKRIA